MPVRTFRRAVISENEEANRFSVKLTDLPIGLREGRPRGTLNSATSQRIGRLAFLWKPAPWRLKPLSRGIVIADTRCEYPRGMPVMA